MVKIWKWGDEVKIWCLLVIAHLKREICLVEGAKGPELASGAHQNPVGPARHPLLFRPVINTRPFVKFIGRQKIDLFLHILLNYLLGPQRLLQLVMWLHDAQNTSTFVKIPISHQGVILLNTGDSLHVAQIDPKI